MKHMIQLWEEIEFKPDEFKLPDRISVNEDNLGSDRIVSTKAFFKPVASKEPLSSPDKKAINSVIISNLPKEINDEEVLELVKIKGNDTIVMGDVKLLTRTERNSRFQIGPINEYPILEKLVNTIDFNKTKEKLFDDQRVYANFHLSIEKNEDEESVERTEDDDVKNVDQEELNEIDKEKVELDEGVGHDGAAGGNDGDQKILGTVPRKQNLEALYKYNKKDCMNAESAGGWSLPRKEAKKFNKPTNFFTHAEIKANKDLKRIVEGIRACRTRYEEDGQSPGKDYDGAPRNPKKMPNMSV